MKDCDWELNQGIPLRLGIQGIKSELNSCMITVLYKYCYNLDSGAMSDICELIIQTIVNVDSQIVKFKD